MSNGMINEGDLIEELPRKECKESGSYVYLAIKVPEAYTWLQQNTCQEKKQQYRLELVQIRERLTFISSIHTSSWKLSSTL